MLIYAAVFRPSTTDNGEAQRQGRITWDAQAKSLSLTVVMALPAGEYRWQASYQGIFGGGGGTITPVEIRDLHAAGITRIYSPDDGRSMGLVGMIADLVERTQGLDLLSQEMVAELDGPVTATDHGKVARLITFAENSGDKGSAGEMS